MLRESKKKRLVHIVRNVNKLIQTSRIPPAILLQYGFHVSIAQGKLLARERCSLYEWEYIVA